MNINKKAVELNVNTIIILILAILVLVVLSLYFTGGMKTLWEKITPVPGAYEQTDLEQAREVCTLYCSANDQVSFCTHKFTVRKITNGEVVGSETKYCDGSKIGALNQPECRGAGFNSSMCKNANR